MNAKTMNIFDLIRMGIYNTSNTAKEEQKKLN
jgi:hypothetical protein